MAKWSYNEMLEGKQAEIEQKPTKLMRNQAILSLNVTTCSIVWCGPCKNRDGSLDLSILVAVKVKFKPKICKWKFWGLFCESNIIFILLLHEGKAKQS